MRTTVPALLLLAITVPFAACSDSPGSGSGGPQVELDVSPDAGVDADDATDGGDVTQVDTFEDTTVPDIGDDVIDDAGADIAPDATLTCADVECDPNATCTDGESGAICVCNPGYEGDGFECTEIDACADAPCDENATCTVTDDGFACACDDGFSGDGFFCVEGDPCADLVCGDNETCIVAPDASASCECLTGYERVDDACVDIDECADSPCDELAECANTDGGFTCTCPDGYEGDGFACADIDECAEGIAECPLFCTNTPGSYVCPCVPPFRERGDGCEAPRVLVYGFPDDGQLLVDAVEAKGWTAIEAASGAEFDERFDEGSFDAIVIDTLADALNRSGNERVIRWVDAGGPLIIGTWNLDFWEELATAVGATDVTSYGEVRPVFNRVASGMDLFSQYHSIPDFTPWEDTFGNNGVTFGVPDGQVLATFDVADGPTAAIGITHGRRVIINGFMPGEMTLIEEYDLDEDGIPDNQELIENELDLILMPWLHVHSDMAGHPLATAARLAGIPVIESDDTTYAELRTAWDVELYAYESWDAPATGEVNEDIGENLSAGVPQIVATPALFDEAELRAAVGLTSATPAAEAISVQTPDAGLFDLFDFIFTESGTLPYDEPSSGPGHVVLESETALPILSASETGVIVGILNPDVPVVLAGLPLSAAQSVDNDTDGLLTVDEVFANLLLALAQANPRPASPELEPLPEEEEE